MYLNALQTSGYSGLTLNQNSCTAEGYLKLFQTKVANVAMFSDQMT